MLRPSVNLNATPSVGEHRAGFVAVVGRPNAGKSTLFNAMLGVKIAIVSPKPETTRNRVAGVKTEADTQFIFLDTPGLHDPRGTLSRRLVHTARAVLSEATVALLVVDCRAGVGEPERDIAEAVTHSRTPTVVALNKMDLVPRSRLLPLMEALGNLLPDREIVPVSAREGENVAAVLQAVRKALPEAPPLYPEDTLTDQPERFIAQEMIREKVFALTHAEIPYASAVVTEQFSERARRPGSAPLLYINATILVGRPSHKPILIGKAGQRLKEIGRQARADLERFFGRRVFLQLYVRVEKGWDVNPATLRRVGL
jgi:GTP-binding protein Era